MNKPWEDVEPNSPRPKVKYAICQFCGWNSTKLDSNKIIIKKRNFNVKNPSVKKEKKEFYNCQKCGRLCSVLKKIDTQYEIDKKSYRLGKNDFREEKQKDFIERKNKFIETLSERNKNEDRSD